jgi:pantetheine-phosphate adenylyltransferase
MKTALYPGTFDPITLGHESIALRASFLFDKVIVAIGNNIQKQCMFSLEERLAMLKKTFERYRNEEIENIEITSYEGLTVDFCKKNDIEYIVRGVRSNADWNVEPSIVYANKLLYDRTETVFLLADIDEMIISSSIVREILRNSGDVSAFVPRVILDMVEKEKKF